MRQRPLIINIMFVLALFFIGSMAFSIVVSILSGLIWFSIKLLIPLAIVAWLVKVIFKPFNRKRYY